MQSPPHGEGTSSPYRRRGYQTPHIVDPLVPDIFKTVGAGEFEGEEKYIPVLWMAVPCIIYFTVIGGIVCLLFTKVFKTGRSSDGF